MKQFNRKLAFSANVWKMPFIHEKKNKHSDSNVHKFVKDSWLSVGCLIKLPKEIKREFYLQHHLNGFALCEESAEKNPLIFTLNHSHLMFI